MGENIVNIYGKSLIYIYFEGEKNKSDNQLPSFWVGEKGEKGRFLAFLGC